MNDDETKNAAAAATTPTDTTPTAATTNAPGDSTAPSSRPAFPVLTPLQARVVAVLYEKQHTVPDTYPMTLNTLRSGVNQKTSRDPLMSMTESEIAEAIDELRGLSLVIESSGSRVMRYEQNIRRVVDIPGASVALLVTLMLRGPQTAAELRMNSERLYRFTDTSSVEAFLREMHERSGGALVRELARRPGERERRWAQLWSGPIEDAGDPGRDAQRSGADSDAGTGTGTAERSTFAKDSVSAAADDTRIAAMQAEIDSLRARLERLESSLTGNADTATGSI